MFVYFLSLYLVWSGLHEDVQKQPFSPTGDVQQNVKDNCN